MKTAMKKTAALLAFVLILVQFATAFDVQAVSGSITSGVESRFTVQFEDTYFDGSSFDYNHKLAQASLGMAMSAFRPTYDKSGKTRPQEHVEQFLIDCGFTYIHSDDYDKNPSLYTVATEIGRKMMVDSNGEPYTLIAVAVCGGGYSNEWLSNFTVGTETEHEGFASAAHLVVDRIFGYIGRANIKGRIKIWISGFSRAAAVGNITAARLVDSGVFSQDDIFAYLFATPRTTKDPRPGEYDNIFSIVGQYDIVPQVPLSGWGFKRYGKVLNTPLKETDSDYSKRSNRVDKVYMEYTGQNFWQNSYVNLQLHTLLGYIDALCPTQEDYANYLQSHIISMFENRSVNNILHTFSIISEDGNLVNDENREIASMLMNFIFRLVADTLTKTGEISLMWNDDSSLTSNLMHEHTQDVYMGWMMSSDNPDEIFTDKTEYSSFIAVPGSDHYVLTVTEGETIKLLVIQDGKIQYSSDRCAIDFKFMTDKSGNVQISFTIPNDRDYRVWYECTDPGDGLVTARIDFDTRAVAESEIEISTCSEAGKIQVFSVSGEVSECVEKQVFNGVDFGYTSKYLPPGLVSETLSSEESFETDWREVILLTVLIPVGIFIAIVLILVLVIKLILKNRFSMIPIIAFFLMFVGRLVEEMFFLMYHNPFPREITKAAMGIVSILFALWGLARRKKAGQLYDAEGRFFIVVAAAVAVLAVANQLITVNVAVGVSFLVLAHLVLVVAYIIRKKPTAYHWLAWVAVSVAFIGVIMIYARNTGNYKYAVSAFACLISLMVVCSVQMPPLVTFGSMLLMVYDILLGLYRLFSNMMLFHVAFMIVYYLAIFCLAYSCSRLRDNSTMPSEPAALPAAEPATDKQADAEV